LFVVAIYVSFHKAHHNGVSKDRQPERVDTYYTILKCKYNKCKDEYINIKYSVYAA